MSGQSASEGIAQLNGKSQSPVVVESADQNHRTIPQIPKAREHGIANMIDLVVRLEKSSDSGKCGRIGKGHVLRLQLLHLLKSRRAWVSGLPCHPDVGLRRLRH